MSYLLAPGDIPPMGRFLKDALRHRSKSGYVVTYPGDMNYDNALLWAEEFFDGKRWRPLSERKTWLAQ